MQTTLYSLAGDREAHDLVERLAEACEQTGSSSGTLTLFDTFDWRLFRKSLALCRRDRELGLYPLSALDSLARQTVSGEPRFAGDIPAGDLRAALEPVVAPRALLVVAQVRADRTHYRVLNRDRKTVLRLMVETLTAAEGPPAWLATHLWLEPVRGYSKAAKRLVRRLQESGLHGADPKARYSRIFAGAARRPGGYDPKPRVRLDPASPAGEATRAVLRSLFEVMTCNLPHILADIDSEFLHDFRVSIRRTRVVLSQLRGVFADEPVERFKRQFSDLGRLTGELRDLDVYLLNESGYRSLLPESLRGDIAPFFDHLRAARRRALGEVGCGLTSQRYRDLAADWEAFLGAPQDAPQAGRATEAVVGESIIRLHNKMQRACRRILKRGDDERVHALRIDGKKLRYLMELFASLYPRRELNSFVRELRGLQDSLGSFHDLQVQESYLLGVAAELPVEDGAGRRALLAVGSLVDRLGERRRQVKTEFAGALAAFAAPANRQLAQRLFAPRAGITR
ncbi:MAG: CHAD domain-containing protein [Truepera sp.]|nr:CHAD domain-containing protein [Truepera sp.]